MAETKDLEKRIKVLEDIEAIRKLKFRYWWTLDHKLWDEFTDCFSEDVVFELFENRVEGRDQFIGVVKGLLARDEVITAHHGHQSDITIINEREAKATWPLRDVLVNSKLQTVFRGRAYYEEKYRKESDIWKITSIKLSYIFATGEGRKYGNDAASMLGLMGDLGL